MPEVSPSVLIIRLDAIGDALALTPLLAAFRRHALPVDIVLRCENAGIFSSQAVRAVIVADFQLRSSAKETMAAIGRLGKHLRQRAYSHVIVATEDPGGYRLAAAVGAPVRIGFDDPWRKPLKSFWSRRLLTRSIYRSAGLDPRAPHECEVLFRLGEPVMGTESPIRDVRELRSLVLEREPPLQNAIAVQITDKWERLGIRVEDVVELVEGVAGYGTPRLLSAAREEAYAARITDATGLSVRYFDELDPWKAAIGGATALVTPDCGALHVAGMIGTPVVAIFPPQAAYELHVARWAPWAATHRIVRADNGWPRQAIEALALLLDR